MRPSWPTASQRLRCGDCGHDKLVASSCKRRGLQPFVRRPADLDLEHYPNCGGELKIIAAIL